MRINARLDARRSQKLEYLTRATNLAISDVIKQAIDLYYQKVREDPPRPAEILRRSGFVGSGEAAADLSDTYKRELSELMAAKHDPR